MLQSRSGDFQVVLLFVLCVAPGCGTTRWSDTNRTATEQLLISNAIDRAVQRIDMRPLAGMDVFLDVAFLDNVVDKQYAISTLRQHLLASGCSLRHDREDASYVVEARCGAMGTDRYDLLYGVPATNINLTGVVPFTGIPTAVPEIPFAKRTDQRAVAKLALFAYHRETGAAVWQSGTASQVSRAKDIWVLGAGPFRRGAIYPGTTFAGEILRSPFRTKNSEDEPVVSSSIPLELAHTFSPPPKLFALRPSQKTSLAVAHVRLTQPLVLQTASELKVEEQPSPWIVSPEATVSTIWPALSHDSELPRSVPAENFFLKRTADSDGPEAETVSQPPAILFPSADP